METESFETSVAQVTTNASSFSVVLCVVDYIVADPRARGQRRHAPRYEQGELLGGRDDFEGKYDINTATGSGDAKGVRKDVFACVG